MRHTPSSPLSALAARAAIAAATAAFVLLFSLHVLSPEFSPAWRLVSEYANGQYAWVLSLMFLAYGASSLALAVCLRSRGQGQRARVGLLLLALAGIGQLAASGFDLNQVAMHEVAGVLGITCLPLGAVLLSPTLLTSQPRANVRKALRLTTHLTWVSVILWIVSFVPMIATFMVALGSLPTTAPAELPPGVIALVGWTDRLMLLAAWAWVGTVAATSVEAHSGSISQTEFATA